MTITADNLGKRFNREWIFKKFSYTFQPGIYAVVGPNGSGKSTLLQVLCGQLPASSGTLHYHDGSNEIPSDEIHKQLAIAAPYLELIEEFTLSEILKFHFSFKKVRGNKTLEELMDSMELGHVRNKLISQFSSGMKQRLKLGLAFYSVADLIFLDEPTTNLDKNSVNWYWDNFERNLTESTVFIGSNLENEYPREALKINLHDIK